MIASIGEAPALIDTNVVIYAYDPADPDKHRTARTLIETLCAAGRAVYSAQVLNEFCSIMLRPNRSASPLPEQAHAILRALAATGKVLPISSEVTLRALQAMKPHCLSFWDALIWAVARERGIPVIYTEDFQHNQSVEGVRFINPFREAP